MIKYMFHYMTVRCWRWQVLGGRRGTRACRNSRRAPRQMRSSRTGGTT